MLDPFCGSGTTLLAAKELQRHYIGIELDKEYFEIANSRLTSDQGNGVYRVQTSLFSMDDDNNI